jgi:predicted dehydrogenase
VVDCSKIGLARSGRYEFVGREGQLVGDQIYNTCQRIHHTTRTPLDPGPPVGTIIPLLHDWRDYLSGRKANPIPARDGLRAVAVCDACLRSAAEQRWVEVRG